MWNKAKARQILLITDGCSNSGMDPVYVAQAAHEQGITVNVIGILDGGALGSKGEKEVENIAAAGGGMCRIVDSGQLKQTMQMMTRHTTQLTLQQVVNKELRSLIGQEQEELPPETRMKVARFVDNLTDEIDLQLVVVIDGSASMQTKMAQVQNAIRELDISLDVRNGEHDLALLLYPGSNGEDVQVMNRFGEKAQLTNLASRLTAQGCTPTGPALAVAVQMFDLGSQWNEQPDAEGKGHFSKYVL
ncbi:VWA domain-containing protein [Fodinisporobacter ferrooxydans]|uniref:VWA domain-containing protein n=1 Tax=Fodinisporobacter ferrooxydans TaxID=2901836 RepID=A0ABY4CQJ2_9BACL|nr:VWA domain-containing protein [Alicyclobacillaceae bacterium MYW30-H2]